MKRLLALLIAIIMSFVAVSCDFAELPVNADSETDESEKTSESTEAEPKDPNESQNDTLLEQFVDFLDGEGFKVGLSQGQFKELIGTYSVSGEKIDADMGEYYDSEYGGGFRGYGEYEDLRYEFTNDFYQDEEKTKYVNYLNTTVHFEGLDLPFGIAFGDDIEVVFEKMGMTYPMGSFVPDEDDKRRMTLLDNGKESLAYVNLHNTDEPVDYYEPFIIVFTEECESELEDGRVKTETRRIMLYFSDFGGALTRLYISAGYQY